MVKYNREIYKCKTSTWQLFTEEELHEYLWAITSWDTNELLLCSQVFNERSNFKKKILLFSKLGLFGLSHLVQRRHDVLNSFMTLAVLHHKDLNVPHSIRRIYIGTFFSRKNPINCCWFGLFKVLKNANNVMNMTLS